jgi:hypothetical protein
MSVKITRSEAEDIAYVLGVMNDCSVNIVSTNDTVVYLDMKVDIEGSGATHLGKVVFDMNEEEFVFFPSE